MDEGKSKKGEWMRLASKSRPGRFYLFNKATGETQWLPSKQSIEEKDYDSPLKLSMEKVKTPAQDRLKRLQHSLKLGQTKPCTSITKPKGLKENEYDAGPSTSSSSRSLAKSSKKAKKKHAASFPSAKLDSVKCAKPSVEENANKTPLPDSPSDKCGNATNDHFIVDVCKEDSDSLTRSASNKNLQIERNGSMLTNIRSGIVKKIKEICKFPFNVTKKIADENSHSKTDESLSLINTSKFKKANKVNSKQTLSASAIKEAVINEINEERKIPPENKLVTCSLSKAVPKSLNIPSSSRGSANLRLERLKQTLLAQQKSSSANYSSRTTTAIETNNNTSSNDHQTNSNKCTLTGEKSRKDEVEAMDWQPIMREESQSEETTALEPTLVVEKSKKLPLKAVNDDENLTMGDIIDTVNGNLLRLSAEKQNDSKKWRKSFYYFIVDTNVLLKDLTFIEDLSEMKLCDTKGTLLYIPYSVLQELDKLKMRSGTQEGVKTLAVRAIKYLNTKLENNSLHVQAQSAVEERQHLININSADDSIINCCLQVKTHIPNLLFLTEDVNLRNKAISNNIMVSTRSDLIAKRYDSRSIS